MISTDAITKAEFDEALSRYPALLKSISDAKKPKKDDEDTLESLDFFRFMDAPNKYMKREDTDKIIALEKDDVVKLVKWKLTHGKFRPNLLNLASSNSDASLKTTSTEAFSTLTSSADSSSVLPALKIMTSLRGIGPATASLLLSMHQTDRVLFFSDEAYQWLVLGGKEGKMKYDVKEYGELEKRATEVMKRLGVGARDVERVAFVVVRENWEGSGAAQGGKTAVDEALEIKTVKKRTGKTRETESNGNGEAIEDDTADDAKRSSSAPARRKRHDSDAKEKKEKTAQKIQDIIRKSVSPPPVHRPKSSGKSPSPLGNTPEKAQPNSSLSKKLDEKITLETGGKEENGEDEDVAPISNAVMRGENEEGPGRVTKKRGSKESIKKEAEETAASKRPRRSVKKD